MPDERPPPEKKPRSDSVGADLRKFLGLGMQLGMTVGLFVALGWWLDQRFDWAPFGVLILGTLGVTAGLYHFLKDASQ